MTMNMGQYTKFQSQLQGGTKLTGGYGDPTDINVDAVAPPLVLSFIISDVSQPSVSLYMINGVEKWYKGGKAWQPTFPMSFVLRDQSTLTIDRNSSDPGDLIYTQK